MPAKTKTLVPGDRLPNAATLVASLPCPRYSTAKSKAIVVLGIFFEGEYVTWIANEDGSGTTWGQYFRDDFDAAVESLRERAGDDRVRRSA